MLPPCVFFLLELMMLDGVFSGMPLKKQQMRAIVDHLAQLENPWSCPHGRPTMRHLFDLSVLPSLLQSSTSPTTTTVRSANKLWKKRKNNE